MPGGGGPSGAAHCVPGGGVSALHHLEADLLLVGTEAGAVLAYQLHPSAAADDGSWDRCELLGAAAVARAAVAQIATAGAAASHAFVLCGGALVALRHALRQQPPLLERASALPIGKVLAMAVRAPPRARTSPRPARRRRCARRRRARSSCTRQRHRRGRRALAAPALPAALARRAARRAAGGALACWAGDEALVVADGAQRLQWASLPPAPLHNAEVLPEDARLEPLLAPSESPASSSGCALALRVTPSEVLLVGGGAHTAVVAVGVPHGRRTRRVGYLQGPPARNATLAWPHLLCATGSTLRVFDLQLGSLAQSLKLAAPPAPRASSASASSSSSSSAAASRSLRVSAFGRHELVLARGDVLFTLAPLAATEAQGERRWLRKVSERPWDAVLVDAHVSQSLALPAHPLTTALSLLAAAFAATFGKKRSPLLSTAFPTPRGIDGIGGAGKDDALCAAACAAARFHAARPQSDALLLLPALAPRFGTAAHGAAGEALLQAVERAASGDAAHAGRPLRRAHGRRAAALRRNSI